VGSKTMPTMSLGSPISGGLQHAAGHGRRQGASLTCQQAAYSHSGSMTMIQVSSWGDAASADGSPSSIAMGPCMKQPCNPCRSPLLECKDAA
jgi:hypothetical protein